MLLLTVVILTISQVYADDTPAKYGWGEWSQWSRCNKECLQTRQRNCTLYPNSYFGCGLGVSQTVDIRRCENLDSSHWSEWAPMGSCNGTCGVGVQAYKRHCYYVCQKRCEGKSMKFEACDNKNCCTAKPTGSWGEWGDFGPCKPKKGICGRGKQTRKRQCMADANCPEDIKFKCKGRNKNKRRCKLRCYRG